MADVERSFWRYYLKRIGGGVIAAEAFRFIALAIVLVIVGLWIVRLMILTSPS